ncbi:hypothetical protein TSMEX_011784 [Taenia solium]|eukprot:TsM_000402800 transcript=TsM_000402800 gene=TsM_000402800
MLLNFEGATEILEEIMHCNAHYADKMLAGHHLFNKSSDLKRECQHLTSLDMQVICRLHFGLAITSSK